MQIVDVLISNVKLSTCKCDKNRFALEVMDLSSTYKDLRIMVIQLWFKKAIAIFYMLREVE